MFSLYLSGYNDTLSTIELGGFDSSNLYNEHLFITLVPLQTSYWAISISGAIVGANNTNNTYKWPLASSAIFDTST